MILSHKMLKEGATKREIEKAMYLAALSHFCIYSPLTATQNDTPLSFNASHQSSIAKPSCTLNDFNRALRARDPLGWGFESSDTLLHLIWRLLAWDPKERMTTADALKHPFMVDPTATVDATAGDQTALESQMLDPRTDFNVSDSIDQFVCPKCGRTFRDWSSCHTHANARKHAKFCSYDKSSLPKCLNAHALLPNHASSGYCGIQGRRRTIEDFHAIHLLQSQQFYGIFDGHLGNFASKYSALFLYEELSSHLTEVMSNRLTNEADDEGNCNTSEWKRRVEVAAMESFEAVHDKFLSAAATRRTPHGLMDQSGTTATILLVSNTSYIVASIGDSRAVLSSRRKTRHNDDGDELVAVQLTTDHVASNKDERLLVESRGGRILRHNPDDGGRDRVNGSLITTRSIGDAGLSLFLSRQPDVLTFTRSEILKACGVNGREWKSTFDSESINLDTSNKKQTRANASTTTSTTGSMDGEAIIPATDSLPCFMILASDGLWDTVSNQEAVDLVHEVVSSASSSFKGTTTTASAQLLQRQQHYDASLSQELPYLPREPTSATSRGRGGGRDELGGGLQQAAEALTLEAYVRGSTDNIAVCIVAID